MREVLPMIVNFALGKARPDTGAMRGFQDMTWHARYGLKSEAARALGLCDEAVARSEKLGNAKLLADCRMVRYWVSILNEYMKSVGGKPGDPAVDAARDSIRDAFADFPEVWRGWLEQNPLSQYAMGVINRRIAALQKTWLPVVKQSKRTGPRVRKLLDDYEAGKVAVMRLQSEWWFRTDEDRQGVKAGYHKGLHRDDQWVRLRIDGNAGWDKQGFADYKGDAWYTTRWFSILPPLRPKQRLYLYIGGIRGDAEIYVNREKARSVSREAAENPMLLDIRPYLPLKQRGLCVVVRVRATASTGGMMGPVFVLGSDRPLTVEETAPFVKVLP
jgi:hypothetical protein